MVARAGVSPYTIAQFYSSHREEFWSYWTTNVTTVVRVAFVPVVALMVMG